MACRAREITAAAAIFIRFDDIAGERMAVWGRIIAFRNSWLP